MRIEARRRWTLGGLVASACWLVTSVCFAGMGGAGFGGPSGFGGMGLGGAAGSQTWVMNGLSAITDNIVGLSGPVAVIALAGGGIGLLFGRDFGQLAHTASYVAIVCGVVATAGTIFNGVGTSGALLP